METEYHSVNMKEWIREQRIEFRDRAFEYPNSAYFKVLEEIAAHKNEFMANTGELLRFAVEYSTTYQNLPPDDKEHVNYQLEQEIFFIDFLE